MPACAQGPRWRPPTPRECTSSTRQPMPRYRSQEGMHCYRRGYHQQLNPPAPQIDPVARHRTAQGGGPAVVRHTAKPGATRRSLRRENQVQLAPSTPYHFVVHVCRRAAAKALFARLAMLDAVRSGAGLPVSSMQPKQCRYVDRRRLRDYEVKFPRSCSGSACSHAAFAQMERKTQPKHCATKLSRAGEFPR